LYFVIPDTFHKLVNQWENVLVSMVKTKRNFAKKKVKSFPRHTAVWVKPMFRITPEAFNAVYVGPALGSASLLSDHDMVASYGKGTIGVPVIGVVKATGLRVRAHKTDNLGSAPPLDREDPDHAVSLEDAENYDLACGSPTAFALSMSAKRGLVAFHGSVKRLPAFFLQGKNSPYQTEEPLHGWLGSSDPETHPVDRDSEHKKFKKSSLGCLREPTGIPNGSPAVSPAATAAFKSPIGKLPCTGIRALRTTLHDQNILHILVRFG